MALLHYVITNNIVCLIALLYEKDLECRLLNECVFIRSDLSRTLWLTSRSADAKNAPVWHRLETLRMI